jgi:DNA-binding transcriptional ArsR family regulator
MQQFKSPLVRWETGPAYEFILSLGVWANLENRELYEIGNDWFKEITASATPDLLKRIEVFGQNCDKIWAHLLGFVYDCPLPRDVLALLAYLGKTEAAEIKLRLAGYYLRYFRRNTSPQTIIRAVNGDRPAQQEFLATSYPEDAGWQAALRRLLPVEAESLKTELLEILEGWYKQVFATRQSQLMPLIERDAQSNRELLNAQSEIDIVEVVTNGWQYIPEPGITNIVLIPSVVIRPLVHSLDQNETKFFCYSVAAENLVIDSDEPSPRLVKLLKALADERRLRILRYLTIGEYTLQQLSEHFEIGKTLMLHHLVILRSVGLIHLRGGTSKRYSLRYGVLPEVSRLLSAYLPEQPTRAGYNQEQKGTKSPVKL